jgi:hypothetical protein
MTDPKNPLKILTPNPLPNGGGDSSKKFCHRFQIPFAAAIPTGPNPLNPQQMGMEVRTSMGFVDCIKDKCTLWDGAECWEKRLMRAQAHLAEKELEQEM